MSVDEYSARFFAKYLQVRAALAPARPPSLSRLLARPTSLTNLFSSSPLPPPPALREASRRATTAENARLAIEKFTTLLRTASKDSKVLKDALRALRDEILRVKDDATAVEALFALFAGAHDLCVRLAGPPSSRVRRTTRTRGSSARCACACSCVSRGRRGGARPRLRARALRLTYRFAKEEEVDRRAPGAGERRRARRSAREGSSSAAAAAAASEATARRRRRPRWRPRPLLHRARRRTRRRPTRGVPSAWLRRAPSSVHGAVDVSSWRAVAGELTKCSGAKLVPVVFALLDEQHEEEAKRRFAARSDPTRVEMDAKTTPTTTTTTTTPTPPAAEVVGSDDASSPKESSPPSPQPSLPDFIDLSGDDPATLELQDDVRVGVDVVGRVGAVPDRDVRDWTHGDFRGPAAGRTGRRRGSGSIPRTARAAAGEVSLVPPRRREGTRRR